MMASIFFICSLSSFLERVPGCREGDTHENGKQRCARQQHHVAAQQGSSDKISPFHFNTTTIRLRITVIPNSTRTGVFSGLFHSGFCFPSRISLRISCSCRFAIESSQPFCARFTAFSVSSSALGRARSL